MVQRSKFFKLFLAATLVFIFIVCVIQTVNLRTRKTNNLKINVDIRYNTRTKSNDKRRTRSTTTTKIFFQHQQDRGNSNNRHTTVLVRSFFEMPFDLDVVNNSFTKCFEEQLDLEAYNRGYNELHNFFSMLGTVFNFIASDVREKIDILENLRTGDSPHKEHYIKTEDMMLHEMEVNKETGGKLYGSRTLLRLHRASKFTMLFLERLIDMKANDTVSDMAWNVYTQSLSNYHSWLVRNAAKLAMYALPNKSGLMKKIVPPGEDEQVVVEKIRNSLKSLHSVYESIEELYTKHDLHGLP